MLEMNHSLELSSKFICSWKNYGVCCNTSFLMLWHLQSLFLGKNVVSLSQLSEITANYQVLAVSVRLECMQKGYLRSYYFMEICGVSSLLKKLSTIYSKSLRQLPWRWWPQQWKIFVRPSRQFSGNTVKHEHDDPPHLWVCRFIGFPPNNTIFPSIKVMAAVHVNSGNLLFLVLQQI